MKIATGFGVAIALFLCACSHPAAILKISLDSDGAGGPRDDEATIQPPLREDIFDYLVAPIPAESTDFTFKSVVVPRGAALAVEGEPVQRGAPIVFSDLKPGPNYRSLLVKARDGFTREYRFNFFRAIASLDAGEENRFSDLGDGTMLDGATGLMWLKDGDSSGLLDWRESLSFVERFNADPSLNPTPYHDWRLPDVVELRSLVNRTVDDSTGWLEAQGFLHVLGLYWTATPYAMDPERFWTVSLTRIHVPLARPKTRYCSVWPVRASSILPQSGAPVPSGSERGGLSWPLPRFRNNGNGTITDNMTGLIWMKETRVCGRGTWDETLRYLEELNDGDVPENASHADWRIPTMAELDGLINFGTADNAAWLCEPQNGFTGIGNFLWSRSVYSNVDSDLLMWGMVLMNGVDAGMPVDREGIGLLPVRAGRD